MERAHTGAPLQQIVQWFKTMTTNEYIRQVRQSGWEPFGAGLWQRDYYEHIIRSGKSLEAIREYVPAKPVQWPVDPDNPLNIRHK